MLLDFGPIMKNLLRLRSLSLSLGICATASVFGCSDGSDSTGGFLSGAGEGPSGNEQSSDSQSGSENSSDSNSGGDEDATDGGN